MKKLLSLFIVSLVLLSGCFSKYTMQVDLTPEERGVIESEIETLKSQIETYVPEDGEIAWVYMIPLSSKYEELGEMDKAIKVYTDVFDDGHKTKAMIHNLGRLYEKVKEFDLAVAQYQRIIDEYFDLDYLYDITWAYIRAGNRKEAEKYFNAWQLEFRKTDEQTQDAIKKLREEEKMSEL